MASRKNMAAVTAARIMAEGAKRVSLYYGSIDDDGAAKIAEELGKNATVEELYLAGNRIVGDAGAARPRRRAAREHHAEEALPGLHAQSQTRARPASQARCARTPRWRSST